MSSVPGSPSPTADCEWATVYGDGTHVDMMNSEPPFFATCCEVGEIDGPSGNPVAPGVIGEPDRIAVEHYFGRSSGG